LITTLYDNKYKYLKDPSEGGFGKVFLAREKVSKRLVAIKQLKKQVSKIRKILSMKLK